MLHIKISGGLKICPTSPGDFKSIYRFSDWLRLAFQFGIKLNYINFFNSLLENTVNESKDAAQHLRIYRTTYIKRNQHSCGI